VVDRDGLWTDVCAVSSREESCRLIVLVGAQMERATGGALKAVRHRVVAERTHSGAE
jgi:isopenicillin N synthase-like dioxygenase